MVIVTFTRHSWKDEQKAEIARAGQVEVDLTELAKVDIQSWEHAVVLWKEMCRIIRMTCPIGHVRIYGVFPGAIRRAIGKDCCVMSGYGSFSGWKLELFEALNVTRPVEGGKPQFTHGGFDWVGEYEPSLLQTQ